MPTDVIIVLPLIVLKSVAVKAGTIIPAGTGALTFSRATVAIADTHYDMHVQPGRKPYSNRNTTDDGKLHSHYLLKASRLPQ